MMAKRRLPGGPRKIEVAVMKANKGKIGKQFRAEAKAILATLEALSNEEAMRLESELAANGTTTISVGEGTNVQLDRDMVSWKMGEKTIHEETFRPHVIEPSFGIGRIIYAVMEHAFHIRADVDAEEDGKEKNLDH